MRIFETVFILALFLSGQILTGCSSTTGNQSSANSPTTAGSQIAAANSNTTKDDIEELGMLVNLPFEPEETVWKESPAGKDSANRKLIAVLRYSDANAEKLTAQLAKLKPPTAETLSTEEWFPAELIAQGEMSGEGTITGKTYAADDFYTAPYSNGKITRIDTTNYFVLQLSAK